MKKTGMAARLLLLIDDDELSRAVIGLVAGDAGFEHEAFESGEAALAHLQARGESQMPQVILTDLQMPGISGDALGTKLRKMCGAKTLVLAMSGTAPKDGELTVFDGFLLKPFSAEVLYAACAGKGAIEGVADVSDQSMLNRAAYDKFAGSMKPEQVAGLYKMCLDDAAQRLRTMRKASVERDDDAYRKAAHAIKGGCGMVGAMELAELAASMEREGLRMGNGNGPKVVPPSELLAQFVAASERLERMLNEIAPDDKARSPINLS